MAHQPQVERRRLRNRKNLVRRSAQQALMRIPDGMPWAEAEAIPNVYLTAHDALVTSAAVTSGESVMVTAASASLTGS